MLSIEVCPNERRIADYPPRYLGNRIRLLSSQAQVSVDDYGRIMSTMGFHCSTFLYYQRLSSTARLLLDSRLHQDLTHIIESLMGTCLLPASDPFYTRPRARVPSWYVISMGSPHD